jgi:lysine 2,3-aminomutase
MPDLLELEDDEALDDPLSEEIQSPVPRLIRRYSDRAVLLASNRCAVYCRFCMRKRKWKKGNEFSDITDSELERVCSFLRETPEVKEILVSGGDPLTLSNARLKTILDALSSINSIEIIRLGSRIPAVMPQRINEKLIDILSSYNGLWFAAHFNHPDELTEESMEACQMIVKAGIPMVNQTVLLKGVNDNADTLEELFRKLSANRIKPLYLFHVDPVKGVRHFSTGIDKGIEIMRSLRNRLSSIATPTFAIDLPEGGGKVPLLPEYGDGKVFESLNGKKVPYQA